MIIVTLVAAVILPWLCFIAIVQMTGGEGAALREIRQSVENIAERAAALHDIEMSRDLR